MKKILLFLLFISQIIFATENLEKELDTKKLEKELDKISYDSNTKSFSKNIYKMTEAPVHFVRPFEENFEVKAVEVDYINGKREGKVIFNKPDGTIFVEGEYKNDKKDGIWKYYPNGFLEKEQEFKNGIYHGKSSNYAPNGKIINTTTYVNGKKEGDFLEYYDSGKLWSTTKYVNNKIDGELKIYYPSGSLYMTSLYKNDSRTGPIIYYYENGNLLLEGNFIKDKPTGIWKFYGIDQKVKYEGKFEEILPLFSEEFSANLTKTLRNN